MTNSEIVSLHEDWWDECGDYVQHEGWIFSKSFKEWLLEKRWQFDLKVLDVLIAVKPCIITGSKTNTLTIGSEYFIESVDLDNNEIMVIDDEDSPHYFAIVPDMDDPKGVTYYFKKP